MSIYALKDAFAIMTGGVSVFDRAMFDMCHTADHRLITIEEWRTWLQTIHARNGAEGDSWIVDFLDSISDSLPKEVPENVDDEEPVGGRLSPWHQWEGIAATPPITPIMRRVGMMLEVFLQAGFLSITDAAPAPTL